MPEQVLETQAPSQNTTANRMSAPADGQSQQPMPVIKKERKVECALCKKVKGITVMTHADLIRPSLVNAIKNKNSEWDGGGYICKEDLRQIKNQYIQDILEDEQGQISTLEQEVVESLRQHEILSENINQEFERELTLGERIADKVAEFGGSWKFIISFGVVIFGWVIMNAVVMIQKPFDPFPFILLNLVLSCLAALQAPVIMMSQNRQEDKDRLRSEYDYKVNLKAELEIRHLNEKLDHLIQYQWQHLLEIQELQLDLMQDMAREKKRATKNMQTEVKS